jgi:hypothetical protein
VKLTDHNISITDHNFSKTPAVGMSLFHLLNELCNHFPPELLSRISDNFNTYDRQLLHKSGNHPFILGINPRRSISERLRTADLEAYCQGVRQLSAWGWGSVGKRDKGPPHYVWACHLHDPTALVHFSPALVSLYANTDTHGWMLIATRSADAEDFEDINVDFLNEDIEIATEMAGMLINML